MQVVFDLLRDYFINNGVESSAARDCADVVVNWAVAGGTIGAGIALRTANPSALLIAAVGATGASIVAVSAHPSCRDVREMVGQVMQSRLTSYRAFLAIG